MVVHPGPPSRHRRQPRRRAGRHRRAGGVQEGAGRLGLRPGRRLPRPPPDARERGPGRGGDRRAPHRPLRGGHGRAGRRGPPDAGEAHDGGVSPRGPPAGGGVRAGAGDRGRLPLPLQPAGADGPGLDRGGRDRRAAVRPLPVRLHRVGPVPGQRRSGGRRGRVHHHPHRDRHLRRPGPVRRRSGHRPDHPLGRPAAVHDRAGAGGGVRLHGEQGPEGRSGGRPGRAVRGGLHRHHRLHRVHGPHPGGAAGVPHLRNRGPHLAGPVDLGAGPVPG